MPGTRPTYEEFSDMPAGLREFLLSDTFDADLTAVGTSFKLSREQTDGLSSKLLDASFNDTTLPKAVADIKAALVPSAIPEERWTAFLSELFKKNVWPLRDLFDGELTQVLTESKIATDGWPPERVIINPLTYDEAAVEIAARVGLLNASDKAIERMRDLLVSKIKGVRSDAQVREMLIRAADVGGVGLDAPTADKVLAAIGELIATAQIVTEQEKEATRSAGETQRSARVTPPSEDEREIEAIKARMPAPVVPSSELEKAVEQVYATISSKPQDEYLARRLRFIISSRLRDVRTPIDVRQLLMREVKVGGMGLPKEQAEPIAAQIEAGYQQFHGAIEAEEQKKLDAQLAEQKLKVEERRKREAEEHAAWYREKVIASKAAFAHPIDAKQQKTELARFGELVPVENNVKVSKTTAELQTTQKSAKQRLDDVQYAGPRLSGPVQELSGLTLAEFRRISNDPRAAAEKILQQIEIVAQESFERRIDAIKAWQSSPLERIYMTLVSEAFRSGKVVTQLADEKRAGGEDMPTTEEINAIIGLNSKLHF